MDIPRDSAIDHAATEPAEPLIRAHYDDFNQRRLEAAAARFDPEARIEDVMGRSEQGPEGYRRFTAAWLTGFPDAQLAIESIRKRAPNLYDVDFIASGSHTGALMFGSWEFKATGLYVQLPARELLQIEDGRFLLASVSFDLQALIRQLAPVDTGALLHHLARIQQLGEQLAAQGHPQKQRELVERIGGELDLARRLVRPYYR
jgi:SnoaL-like polyketide cyclase